MRASARDSAVRSTRGGWGDSVVVGVRLSSLKMSCARADSSFWQHRQTDTAGFQNKSAHAHTHIHIRTYIHTQIHIDTDTHNGHGHRHGYRRKRIQMQMYRQVHIHIHLHVHTQTHLHTFTLPMIFDIDIDNVIGNCIDMLLSRHTDFGHFFFVVVFRLPSLEDSAGVHGRDTLGQTDVIFRTTCPAWDHSSTLILPKYVGNSELAVYPKSFAAVRLALRVWHVETPGAHDLWVRFASELACRCTHTLHSMEQFLRPSHRSIHLSVWCLETSARKTHM